jgi:(p)ppGpp synthase/HD superfamily hydrolase
MNNFVKGGLAEAIWTANIAFQGIFDKNGVPYIYHPFRVAEMVSRLGLDEESQCIALLHDNVEDTEQTLSYLAGKFSPRVVDGVDAMTRRNKKNAIMVWCDIDAEHEPLDEEYFEFVRRASQNLDARKIKMLDIADNMRPERRPPGKFNLEKRYVQALRMLKVACVVSGEEDFLRKFSRLVTWIN